MDTNKVKYGIIIFGVALFVFCLSALVWSLFRKPVTDGPMPEPWPTAREGVTVTESDGGRR
jgi:hypothetical protein